MKGPCHIHTPSHIKSPPDSWVRREEDQGSVSYAGVTLFVEAHYVVGAVEVRDVITAHGGREVSSFGKSGCF